MCSNPHNNTWVSEYHWYLSHPNPKVTWFIPSKISWGIERESDGNKVTKKNVKTFVVNGKVYGNYIWPQFQVKKDNKNLKQNLDNFVKMIGETRVQYTSEQ